MLSPLKLLASYFMRNTMGFYYAVAKGRSAGIYETWEQCKAQVHKFPGPVYKKFASIQDAQNFIDNHRNSRNNGRLTNTENFVHTRAPVPDDLVALGTNAKTRVSKRARSSDQSNEESSVKATKRAKPVASPKTASSSTSSKTDKDKHFDMDATGFVNVYTDGACSGNGYKRAKAGIGVYFGEHSPLNVSAPVVGRATNNVAEIQAVKKAAQVAQEAGITKLRIHTDSELLIKSITAWMPNWKRRGWTTDKGTPVANKEELQEMESALKLLKVEWNHVRGHQGIHGNEMADKLAREGAKLYAPR